MDEVTPDGSTVASAPTDEPEADAADRAAPEPAGVTFGQVFAVLFAAFGLRLGFGPLSDNSFLTHLATGRIIVEGGGIPRADPYSFTALGEPWTVQSWLASAIYGALDAVGGLTAVRSLVALSTMLLALVAWRLTRRATGLVPRLAIASCALAVGATQWVERPLLFGLLALGAVLLALDDDLDPRWLVPIAWVWVNTHGSFPYGLLAIVAFGLGRLLDRERPTRELRVLGWTALGTALAVVNPLGLELLLFPARLLERREAFTIIEEWQAPTWQHWGERFFAVQLVLAVVLLAWRGRTWRAAIPLVVFAALAFQSSRNILQASLVLLPGMAAAAGSLGSIRVADSLPILKPVRAALVALLVLLAVGGLVGEDLDLREYPVQQAEWMREEGLLGTDARVVTRETVGNYFEANYGPDEVRTYLDDRVDMYPQPVLDGYLRLVDPDGDYEATLDEVGATAVLWDEGTPFANWLEDPENGWDVIHRDEGWLVAIPA